ncbi:PAS domain-containing sensor histidine kinase [Pseudomonas auratipiscis]|uniref:histidine kinase n=1 Tax=Pseudomonas auratipiscis TaxID=3115853 RepID=A0AB35WYT3_9PSED|nr:MULTISPECIES: PAS domain S-box protein [unclassified Pseudomonas]MEE1868497.1 PAS domain S-box protein [Pseudomonas sp. 120P]MEE1959158.1 PAS domain S-box protein [Pseudomonas sp. 119P]
MPILLASDPQPSVLLDASAALLAVNPALQAMLGPWPERAVDYWLPANYQALVSACLNQARAISEVEALVAGQILLWTFVPDCETGQVLARCRDATAERVAEREASQARRLYRLITENTTDLISRHSPDGCFLDASPASYRLLGYWPEQLRGVAVQSLFHPQDRRQSLQLAAQALEQDGYQTMTCRVRHRDGHDLWFEIASRAIRETYTGVVVEIVSVSRDITSRIEAQENRRRLAQVVEANTDLVLFTDRTGRLSYLNRSARRALGLQDVDPLPSLQALLDPGLQHQLAREGWQRAEQTGVWHAETRLIPWQGGQVFPVSLVLLAHRGNGGERYYSLVARDMTERELRESQQRRHQDELAHSARLITLGELASGIAHEINQPLAAVVNYAGASQRYLQALDRDPQAATRVAQGLTRISEQATHAAEVIKRLRAFLRKEPRRLQALAIADVAADAVRLCDWEASRDRVSIVQDMADPLPQVYADRVLLEQVLLNLLRNALDANREQHQGQPSRIVLGAALVGGQVQVLVSDQGPGVAAQRLDGIFTPFTTSKPEGLGLGLSMSRSIIEGFGGTLQAMPGAAGGLTLCCQLVPVASAGTEEA